MEWISVKDRLPISEKEETGCGLLYFSKPVLVKRGSRKWRAVYQVEKKRFYTNPKIGCWTKCNPQDITDYVHEWMPIPEPTKR